jgi:FkbM family methyltransferase
LIGKALVAAPDDPELLFARGVTLFRWGRFREARDGLLQAEAKGMKRPSLYCQLAWSCSSTGNLSDAEAWMRKAVDAEPAMWEAHFGLAVALQMQRRTDEAIAGYERVLELRADDFESLINSGICRLDQGDPPAAEVYFRRAIAVDGERAKAWSNLGAALGQQDRDREALEAFARAERLGADTDQDLDIFVNIAINLQNAGLVQDGLDLLERNLAQRPNVNGHIGYAHDLLTVGRLPEGWSHYEFRWLGEPGVSRRPRYPRPVWRGQDLHGKTIFLRSEQGFGDTFHFVRYAPHVKALGATVYLGVFGGLESLAQSFPGVDRVFGPDESPEDLDFYISLMSLPGVFGTDLASIPAETPYLHADPVRVERWANRLPADGTLRVGLVWAGSSEHLRDRYRSLSLRSLAPLGEVEGVRWFSLQKGPAASEADALSPGLQLVNLDVELEDFSDTAAAISQLDLVICVDTAVAHLAGALGKPVWLMLPSPFDWRWLQGREDSPWYPTMRLFRQTQRGEWSDVVERVKAALQERLQGEPSGMRSNATFLAQPQHAPVPLSAPRPGPPPGHHAGFSAVTETRVGILQYLPDEAVIGDSIGWYGEFLQPQLDLLARVTKPGATVIEVGAGIGVHSVFLAGAVGAAGHLLVYEPRRVAQRLLRQNLAANRVTNVTVMRRALGSNGESGTRGNSEPLDAADPDRSVATTETLDELQLERLDWLKINDGVPALEVLDGAADSLWRLRPMLFIAAPDTPMLMKLASRVKEFSYRCWRMETPFFNPENFNRRETDIFAGRTALALLAIPEEIEVDIALDGCIELS